MILPLRTLIVSVDYADLLALTLPYNREHFAEVWVVTSARDEATQRVAQVNNVNLVLTELFWEHGAEFAKFKAVEYAMDRMGRHGWLVHLDADVCWPKDAGRHIAAMAELPKCGFLYGSTRRMLEHPDALARLTTEGIPPESTWKHLRLHPGIGEWAGFTQLYHADDPILGTPPWHDVTWRHAGGGDSQFMQKWPRDRKRLLPFEVLHLGSDGCNWMGRSTPMLDGSPVSPGAEERIRRVKDLWIERAKTGFSREKLP